MTIRNLRYFLPSLALLALAGTATFAVPSFAADAPAAAGKASVSHEEKADDRIKEIHDKLGITADQEKAFGKLADVMRDNAKNMDETVAKEEATEKTATALDDLKAYQATVQAHADNVKELIPAFESLYTVLNDDQKKEADSLFIPRKGPGKKMSKKS
jgi:membrane-bound lytic murein transglycosylase B